MRAILDVILLALQIYTWIVIATVVFSWLYAFGVVNPRNQFVASIGQFLYAVTEPVLRPIRRFIARILPNLGPIDISPIVLFLLIYFIRVVIIRYLYPNVF
jgi:YggT family protein